MKVYTLITVPSVAAAQSVLVHLRAGNKLTYQQGSNEMTNTARAPCRTQASRRAGQQRDQQGPDGRVHRRPTPYQHHCIPTLRASATARRYRVWQRLTRFGRLLTIEILRADEGEMRLARSSAGMKGRGKREIPEKTCRTAASSGAILTCEDSGAIPPGMEPGSPSCTGKRDWGMIGKESAMAFVRDTSQHSPGGNSESHGKPDRGSNTCPSECESSELPLRHLARVWVRHAVGGLRRAAAQYAARGNSPVESHVSFRELARVTGINPAYGAARVITGTASPAILDCCEFCSLTRWQGVVSCDCRVPDSGHFSSAPRLQVSADTFSVTGPKSARNITLLPPRSFTLAGRLSARGSTFPGSKETTVLNSESKRIGSLEGHNCERTHRISRRIASAPGDAPIQNMENITPILNHMTRKQELLLAPSPYDLNEDGSLTKNAVYY
ncbi:hypothetical protein PR048_024673 [Dryococelus australis]|uniref:Uncharacterized protein n=1 Tax=Dryococelus australis TaxID=614101 RepID=A0ABQ9GP75_9NEOP|nr:hypothetical protein PR048_024673 [Dryococelus australis]